MEGDIADLPGILRLAKPYGARTYVDEAHGIGVLGATGAGAAELYINPVLRPAAAQNLLRISCTAAHTEAHVERLVNTLDRVANALGIPR
jgi:7-keto-8-aminopelargonate synthetase-like enzyme